MVDWNKKVEDSGAVEPTAGGTDWSQKIDESVAVDREWIDVIGSAIDATPRSLYRLGSDMIRGVVGLTPFSTMYKGGVAFETPRMMGNLAKGAISKIPGASYLLPGPTYDIKGQKPRAAEFDAMVGFFKKRYGTIEGFKEALATDPAGVTADVATPLTGGGAAIRGAGKVGTMARSARVAGLSAKAERVGEIVQKAGAYMDPVQMPKHLLKAGDKIRFRGSTLPERWYDSAVKWNTASKRPGEMGWQVRQRLTRTALEEKVMPHYRGLMKLEDSINVLNEEIGKLVREPTMRGVKVPAERLLDGFDSLEKSTWDLSTGHGRKEVAQIKAIRKDFESVHGIFMDENGSVSYPLSRKPGEPRPDGYLVGFQSLTPEQIQGKKVKAYKTLEAHYNRILKQPVNVEAQKLIARNAKEALTDISPELAEVNAKYGPLADLYNAIDQKAARISNYNIISLTRLITGGAGYSVGGTKGLVVGVAIGMLDDPLVKSKLAIVIHDLKKRGIEIKPSTAAIDLGLFQTGREARQQQERKREASEEPY